MACSRRLQKELEDIRAAGLKSFINLQVDETNIMKWEGLILPENPPYNKGAFKIELVFPEQYPFKPPVVIFKTKIYHPNIDEHGHVCLPIVHADNWKPALKAYEVIQALINLVNHPEPDHPLRVDVAEEYVKERKKFTRTAEEFTRKYGEKRPAA